MVFNFIGRRPLRLLVLARQPSVSVAVADQRERPRKDAEAVQTDTERFAADFNKEIQSAYFNFQINADAWKAKNWEEFNARVDYWKKNTAYPTLIKDFYFTENTEDAPLLRYDRKKKAFEPVPWTPELKDLRARFTDEKTYKPVYDEVPALVMPVREVDAKISHIMLKRAETPTPPGEPLHMPKKFGHLVIALDSETISGQILPNLVKNYFPDGDYDLAVTDSNEKAIFQTRDPLPGNDAASRLFDIAPDFVFFANKDMLPREMGIKREIGENKRELRVDSKVESRTLYHQDHVESSTSPGP